MKTLVTLVFILLGFSASAGEKADDFTYGNIISSAVEPDFEVQQHLLSAFTVEELGRYNILGKELYAKVKDYYRAQNEIVCKNRAAYENDPAAFAAWWDATELGFLGLLAELIAKFREDLGAETAAKLASIEKVADGDRQKYERPFNDKDDVKPIIERLCQIKH